MAFTSCRDNYEIIESAQLVIEYVNVVFGFWLGDWRDISIFCLIVC
ncbi:hypothetical protein QWZ13_16785 [Reinekea marina]|nr:hypothetical protein [Reinekea marina]MDN3650564.1 hypothetical protein [Reinekea marina]